MIATRTAILTLAALAFVVSGPAQADKIVQTDGTVLEDITIEEETLTEIQYKDGNDRKTVASEKVLEVSFERAPRMVDTALAALAEDDIFTAVNELDAYVDEQIEKANERRFKWAPAFAASKALELRMELADLDGARAAAARLINNFPTSRYLPGAYLAKAEAELQSSKADEAAKTLTAFSELIKTQSLSKRWELECRLAQIQADAAKSGEEKRGELDRVASEAGAEFPTVTSRARVAQGETYLEEAKGEADVAKAQALREQAVEVFQAIVEDPKADDATLAGAHTGLGECLFYRGADADDAEVLKQASIHYLRVITLYNEQSRYVPKALFFAMRCFELTKDRRRKSDMRRELAKLYPGSEWDQEAAKFD